MVYLFETLWLVKSGISAKTFSSNDLLDLFNNPFSCMMGGVKKIIGAVFKVVPTKYGLCFTIFLNLKLKYPAFLWKCIVGCIFNSVGREIPCMWKWLHIVEFF
jgi:hypothetical protein